MNEREQLIGQITQFIESIGIQVCKEELHEDTFLPGIEIDKGVLKYDPGKLKYPGDLLHEAGHIAVMEKETRELLSGNVKAHQQTDLLGDEMAAILWSCAASIEMKLPLNVVFHPDGYRGASDWYMENFQDKNYIGLPLLVWMRMTNNIDRGSDESNQFPKMTHWLRP